MRLRFPQTHNPWIDAGIVGFAQFVELETPPEVEVLLLNDRLELSGDEQMLKKFLDEQFQRLVEEWYNASSAKQNADLAGYFFDPMKSAFDRRLAGALPSQS